MGCGLDAVCVRRVSSFGPVIVRVGRGLPVDFSSTKETRIKKKAPRQLVVFPLLHHGSGSSSPELCRNGDFGHRIQIQVYGEGEEDEGVQFWGLRAWEIEVFHGGRGSRGFGSGSLLVAERGTGAAWGRSRRLWGCSPRRESNQDGSMEEIDECSVLRLEEGSTCGWCARRRAANGARRHGVAPGSIYRRPKAVRGEKNLGQRTVHGDDGTAMSWSSDDGRTIRPAVGHGSAVDCGGRPGWSDVHEGVVELLLSLCSWRPLKFSSDVSKSSSAVDSGKDDGVAARHQCAQRQR